MPKMMIIVDVDDDMYTHAKVSLAYKDEDGYWADVNYETLPLRPLPEKGDTVSLYSIGWNDCIDEILGETE